MKILKNKIFLGFMSGLFVGILALGGTVALVAKGTIGNVKTDLSDEIAKVTPMTENADEALIQKDY